MESLDNKTKGNLCWGSGKLSWFPFDSLFGLLRNDLHQEGLLDDPDLSIVCLGRGDGLHNRGGGFFEFLCLRQKVGVLGYDCIICSKKCKCKI